MAKQNPHLAFIFPGQGSQQIGMLKEIADHFPGIEKTFAQASNALDKDLWALAQTGKEEEINRTINTQPLLLTAGVALWRAWQSVDGAEPSFFAGHSLGEYTALVCANALTLEDAVKLVALRGQAMQEAVPEGQGAMAAVLGMDDALLLAICNEAKQGEVVAPVNFNAIGQTVIAGNKAAVERASNLAREKGAKKVILLPVSVPSHCALMQSAALKLSKALENIPLERPSHPVIHNVDVQMHSHPDDIKEALVKQLSMPVEWVKTIQRLREEEVNQVVECGPGKVLSGLIKRIDPQMQTKAIESKAGFDEALETC